MSFFHVLSHNLCQPLCSMIELSLIKYFVFRISYKYVSKHKHMSAYISKYIYVIIRPTQTNIKYLLHNQNLSIGIARQCVQIISTKQRKVQCNYIQYVHMK
jgi:hypothetical protein